MSLQDFQTPVSPTSQSGAYAHLKNAVQQFTVLKTAQDQHRPVEIRSQAQQFLDDLCQAEHNTELLQTFKQLQQASR